MRIPTLALSQNALRSLRDLTARTARAQLAAADGKRIRTMSDDPVAAGDVLRIDSDLRGVTQYQRNQLAATQRMSIEDVALTSAQKLMQTARTIASGVESLPPGDPARQAAIAQIQTLRDQLVALGNTKSGDEYVFAGGKASQPAFDAAGTWQGDTNLRQTEIDDGVTMTMNHTGDQVIAPGLAGLSDLATQLGSGTPAQVQAAMNSLNAAETGMRTAQAETGARMGTMKDLAANQDQAVLQMQNTRSALADVDPAQAVVELQAQQTALQQAYAVTSKVLSLNLLDFLK